MISYLIKRQNKQRLLEIANNIEKENSNGILVQVDEYGIPTTDMDLIPLKV